MVPYYFSADARVQIPWFYVHVCHQLRGLAHDPCINSRWCFFLGFLHLLLLLLLLCIIRVSSTLHLHVVVVVLFVDFALLKDLHCIWNCNGLSCECKKITYNSIQYSNDYFNSMRCRLSLWAHHDISARILHGFLCFPLTRGIAVLDEHAGLAWCLETDTLLLPTLGTADVNLVHPRYV